MQNEIVAIEKLLPEAVALFKERYVLLQTIMQKGPIGRRSLTSLVPLSERTIRSEVDKLAHSGLVQVATQGITITRLGEEILNALYVPLHYLEALTRQEDTIQKKLKLKRVIILKGNLEKDEEAKVSLGFAINNLLEELLKPDMTLAITGGKTMADIAEYMPRSQAHYKNIHIIPARGSVGQRVELHASSIAAKLGEKLEGHYEVLTIPDNLSHQSISLIKNEPQIEKILQKLLETDMIIFGIGNALKMAKYRKEPESIMMKLESHEAVAEAFRHYFNAEGEVVHGETTIGISPEMAKKVPISIAVAGGKGKVAAILATRSLFEGGYLVIDEEAADIILEKLT